MKKYRRILLVCVTLAMAGCATVPFDYPKEPSTAISPDEESSLRSWVQEWKADNIGPSGFYPLVKGSEGLGARLTLIENAQKTGRILPVTQRSTVVRLFCEKLRREFQFSMVMKMTLEANTSCFQIKYLP